MGSHRSTGYSSQGRSTGSPTIHGYGDTGRSSLGMETHRSSLGMETHRSSLGMDTHRSSLRPTGYSSHSGSMFYTDTRGRTRSPQGALGRQDQFTMTMLFPGVNFTLWRICRVRTNEDLVEGDTDLTKFLNSVAMVRRIHGDNLPGPTTRLQEVPIAR